MDSFQLPSSPLIRLFTFTSNKLSVSNVMTKQIFRFSFLGFWKISCGIADGADGDLHACEEGRLAWGQYKLRDVKAYSLAFNFLREQV